MIKGYGRIGTNHFFNPQFKLKNDPQLFFSFLKQIFVEVSVLQSNLDYHTDNSKLENEIEKK